MSQTLSPAAEQRRKQLDYATSITKLYFRHASTLFAHYDEWKDVNEFYFIELRLDMAYVSTGFIARMANAAGTSGRNAVAGTTGAGRSRLLRMKTGSVFTAHWNQTRISRQPISGIC